MPIAWQQLPVRVAILRGTNFLDVRIHREEHQEGGGGGGEAGNEQGGEDVRASP